MNDTRERERLLERVEDAEREVRELRQRVVELEGANAKLATDLEAARVDANAWAQIAGSFATDNALVELRAKLMADSAAVQTNETKEGE